MIITLQDCRNSYYCSKGVRAFFDKYGLDYTAFLKNGIDSAIILDLNDSMGNKVVETARGRK